VPPFFDQPMKALLRAFRQKNSTLPKWAALDHESLRLNSALEYINRYGKLDRFSGAESENLALMSTATHQRLVRWNRNDSRYELTNLGRQRLGANVAVPAPIAPAAPTFPSRDVRTAVFGSGAAAATVVGVVVGAAVMASMHTSPEIEPPHGIAGERISEPSQGREPVSAKHQAQNDASPTHAMGGAGHSSEVSCRSGTCPKTGNSATAENAVQPEKKDPGGSSDMQANFAADPPALPSELAIAAPPASGAHETQRPPPSLRGQKAALQTTDHSAEASEPDRVPNRRPLSRRGGTGWKVAKSIGHHAERTLGDAHASPRKHLEAVGYARSASESIARVKRDTDRTRRGRHEPQQTWSSARTANVTRIGLLVREERKLPDGTALVRYQYGNGPPRFEVRGMGDRGSGRGYAYGLEHFRRTAGLNLFR
jgi:hypothetical protein